MKKLDKKAQEEYQYIKFQLDNLIKQVYLRGKIDALENVNIDLDKEKDD